MNHAKWALVQMAKKTLASVEAELIRDTIDERDPSESHDVALIERARLHVSEALVQIALFEESRTGHKWRQPIEVRE